MLETALSGWQRGLDQFLAIRTLPNPLSKTTQRYVAETGFAFFTIEAVEFLNQIGVRHLLVDVPSIDRMYDDGLLTNHHIFWNVVEGESLLKEFVWREKTLTEMIYVADEIEDGRFALNLQIPQFKAHVAPSRPILIPIKEINHG